MFGTPALNQESRTGAGFDARRKRSGKGRERRRHLYQCYSSLKTLEIFLSAAEKNRCPAEALENAGKTL